MEQILKKYSRIVIKFGTSVLTAGNNSLDIEHMRKLSVQIAQLIEDGVQVIICTSGAIACGRAHLNYPELSQTIANKQLLAAVGQSQLMLIWSQLFREKGIFVGQLLLTQADLRDRGRYLNAKDALNALLDQRIIPIVNENDAVATTEIKIGDNDNLSARVALLAEADLLVLLTDQKGLFDSDPRVNPDAKLIASVDKIDMELKKLATGAKTNLGTGGMITKLEAAHIANRSGIPVIIASGSQDNVILKIKEKEQVGTYFKALDTPLESRKQWILAGSHAIGSLTLDKGAAIAVTSNGRSLLAKGIVDVKGHVVRGETVQLLDQDGVPIAKGIVRYSKEDLSKICKKHSTEIMTTLGYTYGDTVVHRNDMVIL